MRTLVIVLALILSNSARASGCDAYQQIEQAGLYQNEKFWEDFAELSAKGEPSPSQVTELIAKHKPTNAATAPTPPAPTPATELTGSQSRINGAYKPGSARASLVGHREIKLSKDGEKQLAKAPPGVQKKFDKFIELVNEKGLGPAVQQMRGQHSWNYEGINDGHIVDSFRLDQGYRVSAEIKDGVIIITGVGKNLYRH